MTRKVFLKTTKDSEAEFFVLDETLDFSLLIGPRQIEPSNGQRSYLLYNKGTGVFEAEGVSEAHARIALKNFQEFLEQVKSGKVYEQPLGSDILPPILN